MVQGERPRWGSCRISNESAPLWKYVVTSSRHVRPKKNSASGEAQFGSDAREFVERDFYVDDGLKSLPGSKQSIDLLQRTQGMLATANLRLHKIASNDANVTQAFPSEDRASELCNLDLNNDTKPIQRSLGVYWDLETDTFTFKVSEGNKPFTRRGVLSVINSLFDPLGIVSPVIIKGKMLLRTMSAHLKNRQFGDWDEPNPEEHNPAWMEWCQSLSSLQQHHLPRQILLSSMYSVTLPSMKSQRFAI